MNYLEELRKLNLPLKKYAVFGSGVLALRGLRENRDLDIIVKKDLWEELTNEYSVGENGSIEIGHIEIWDEKGIVPHTSVEGFIDRAEIINGIRYVRLEDLLEWKKAKGREKDLKDVELIEEFLH